jgi:hypothetical protein
MRRKNPLGSVVPPGFRGSGRKSKMGEMHL